MEIISLNLFACKGYQDLYRRSYKAVNNGQTMMLLDNATRGGQALTQTALAGVASQVIAPSAEVEGVANIINGWGTNRYRFIMEVIEYEFTGAKHKAYYVGYTDYCDGATVTLAGNQIRLDPQLQFHITSSHRIKLQNVFVNGQQGVRPIQDSSTQLIFNQGVADIFTGNNMNYLMRPTDIFNSQSTADSMRRLGILPNSTIDTTGSLATQGNQSNYRNNNPTSYLFDTFKAYQNGYDAVREYGLDDTQFAKEAKAYLKDGEIFYDPFFSRMADVTREIRLRGYFAWNELLKIAPHIDNITQIWNDTSNNHWHAGNTANWNSALMETVIASLIVNSLPPIMLDNLSADIRFSMHNLTVDGSIAVQVQNYLPISNELDSSQLLNRVLERCKLELAPILSANNQRAFNILVDATVFGDVFVSVSIDSQPAINYVQPAFADNMVSPVLTNNLNTYNQFTHDIYHIGSQLLAK